MKHKRSFHLAVLLMAGFTLFFRVQDTLAHPGVSEIGNAPAFQQSNQSIEGIWQGALDAGAFKLRLLMKFSHTADGKLKGLLDSLDQGASDIPMDVVTFQNGVLHVELKSIGAAYDGKLSADGTPISGEFFQGSKLPLELKRIEKVSDAAFKRPQTPKQPYPYD